MQDTVGAAEKVLEQMADPRQRARLDQRLGQLRDKHDSLSRASSDRVETLEEALPLTLQFNESHEELSRWLNDAENEMRTNKEPGLNAEEIKKEVDKNRVSAVVWCYYSNKQLKFKILLLVLSSSLVDVVNYL